MENIELRDYFAAHALQGLLACPNTVAGSSIREIADKLSTLSYEYADAMLMAKL